MEQNKRMPVGVDDFKKLREEYYFVDKTKFIRELIDGHRDVTLITRPRRFGKTLTMSMLYYFFTNENAGENRKLFNGTEIAAAGEAYMAEQGTRPVVFLTLKDVKMNTWEACL
ncbi:MAG: AAA family ATPase, partial [Schwartzia sp.]|nr:AAA family ATPase [Schwartzia sp. (in: firmicutes)]